MLSIRTPRLPLFLAVALFLMLSWSTLHTGGVEPTFVNTWKDLDSGTQTQIISAARQARPIAGTSDLTFNDPLAQISARIGQSGTLVVGRSGTTVELGAAAIGRPSSTEPSTVEDITGVGTAWVTVDRSAGGIAFTERWHNAQAGLEQQFELAQRPGGTGELLVLQQLSTTLTAAITSDGKGVTFSSEGSEHLRFNGLKAWDATGRTLEAHMELIDGSLAYVISDQDAIYPITIDPTWDQQAFIKANASANDDEFGASVAIDGNTLVVASPFYNSLVPFALMTGALYVFDRDNDGVWTQTAVLIADDAKTSYPQFGYDTNSVDISGDRIVVTGNFDSVDDNGNRNLFGPYVFAKTNGAWAQQKKFEVNNLFLGTQHHSRSVAIDGDLIVSGDSTGNSCANGAEGDAWAYKWNAGNNDWGMLDLLCPSNGEAFDNFGQVVDVSGTTLVVGATGEDGSGAGVNPNNNNLAGQSGAVYVFEPLNGGAIQTNYIKAFAAGAADFFGWSVAIQGDTLVVGAPGEDSDFLGVLDAGDAELAGALADNDQQGSGAVYVYKRQNGVWSEQAFIKATKGGDAPFVTGLGTDVAISEDETTVAALEIGGGANNFGSVFSFVLNAGVWSQQAIATNPGDDNDFGGLNSTGHSIAISGTTLVVGAPTEDSDSSGINAQANNDGSNEGAVYVFKLAADPPPPPPPAPPAPVVVPPTPTPTPTPLPPVELIPATEITPVPGSKVIQPNQTNTLCAEGPLQVIVYAYSFFSTVQVDDQSSERSAGESAGSCALSFFDESGATINLPSTRLPLYYRIELTQDQYTSINQLAMDYLNGKVQMYGIKANGERINLPIEFYWTQPVFIVGGDYPIIKAEFVYTRENEPADPIQQPTMTPTPAPTATPTPLSTPTPTPLPDPTPGPTLNPTVVPTLVPTIDGSGQTSGTQSPGGEAGSGSGSGDQSNDASGGNETTGSGSELPPVEPVPTVAEAVGSGSRSILTTLSIAMAVSVVGGVSVLGFLIWPKI